MIQCSHTVESFEFLAANFCVNCGVFCHSWGYNFIAVLVFSFSKKDNGSVSKFVFMEDVNLLGSATHEYYES